MRKASVWFLLILYAVATIGIFFPIIEMLLQSRFIRAAVFFAGAVSIYLRSVPRLYIEEFKTRNIIWCVAGAIFWVLPLFVPGRYAIPVYGILLAAAHFDFYWQKRMRQSNIELREHLGKYLDSTVVDRILAPVTEIKRGSSKVRLSIMFADIRGYTGMAERIEPSKLVAQLNEFLTVMERTIKNHHGMVDKYIGDAVMAIFGIGSEDSEHTADAVKSACEMMQMVKKLNLGWVKSGMPVIEIGIGIAEGDVILGNIGSHEQVNYTAVGDAVNVASRLAGMAKGNDILVSGIESETGTDFGGGIKLDLLGSLRVRGRDSGVPTYQVVGYR